MGGAYVGVDLGGVVVRVIQALAGGISSLCGWRRWALAFALGASSVLAMAPWFAWPILFPTFTALIWLLDGAIWTQAEANDDSQLSRIIDSTNLDMPKAFRSAFATGWFFGFGYFFVGLAWIGEAFFVEAEKFVWLLPFAISLLPATLAIFYGLAAGLSMFFWRPGAVRIIVLAMMWSAFEWFRGHMLTGFPWNAVGYGLTGSDALLQLASVFGLYGLSFWAVLLFGCPAVLANAYRGGNQDLTASRFAMPLVMLALLVTAAGWGAARLRLTVPDVLGVKLRLVQPNIAQTEKWTPGNQRWIFERLINQSRLNSAGRVDNLAGVTYVIWPESSLPFLLLRSDVALAEIDNLLPLGAGLILGGIRMVDAPPEESESSQVFNSLLVLDDESRLQSHYDKTHLVPFGEYLPFQNVLESIGLEQLTRMKGGFHAGHGIKNLAVPNAPSFIPLICYEAIFPGRVTSPGARPQWMLNLTNDAWFGSLYGPYQHFHQARVRAVEEGLPLIRVANTGISAVIDPYGRKLAMLAIGQLGTLDSALPRALEATPFAQFRDLGIVLQLSLAAAACVALVRLSRT